MYLARAQLNEREIRKDQHWAEREKGERREPNGPGPKGTEEERKKRGRTDRAGQKIGLGASS